MKIKVLTEVKVIADMDKAVYWARNEEERAKQLQRAVNEFNDFVRDHRSMDWVNLRVDRTYESQCSHCGNIWETDNEGVPVCCQNAIEEHEGGVFSAMGFDAPKPPTIAV